MDTNPITTSSNSTNASYTQNATSLTNCDDVANNTATSPIGTPRSVSSSSRSTKQSLGKSSNKSGSNSSTNRFQCPKCPKNFSRIENLTRHQANHMEVGKFACIICKKRFTRSDLLSRHRRIHVQSTCPNQGPTSIGSSISPSPTIAYRDTPPPPPPTRHIADAYDTAIPPPLHQSRENLPSIHDAVYSSTSPSSSSQPQGLSSLVEAALAPPPLENGFRAPPAEFHTSETHGSTIWDGFMLYNDTPSIYMGSYDADISWAFDSLSQDSWNYMELDFSIHSANFGKPEIPIHVRQNTDSDPDGEDEGTDHWPDKVTRSESPPRWAAKPRTTPRLGPDSWQAVGHEARMSSFVFGPKHQINESVRASIIEMLQIDAPTDPIYGIELNTFTFPPTDVLDYFLRLYFQHVHPRFPITHIPTFNVFITSPLLLVSMMFLGSSHSKIDRGRFSRLFHNRARVASMRLHELEEKHLRVIDNIFTLLNMHIAGAWSGNKIMFEFAEGVRGILVTSSRRARLLDCRPISRVQLDLNSLPRHTPQEIEWLSWIETEKRKRLGLAIYIFDCQYAALFNLQPCISKAETTNCVFPCPDQHWEATTPQAWKMLVGPADMPPSTYYLHALNGILLHKWTKPPPPVIPTSMFGKTLLIYAIHTHIFDWRTSVSMLNPTGLMGTMGNHAHDIGAGLLSRRRWLIDALDSWNECYGESSSSNHDQNHNPNSTRSINNPGKAASPITKDTSPIPGTLLCKLGYIALDVSLSDVHLMAGRSVNKQDSEFAAVNLRFWANSEIADGTMKNVLEMLGICEGCLSSGAGSQGKGGEAWGGNKGWDDGRNGGRPSATGKPEEASYEIAVCLFTGAMVCWVYAQLRNGLEEREREMLMGRVRKAGEGLRDMGCWRMGEMFGRILGGFGR